MINRELMSRLTPDEMPSEETREIALLVGVENALKILHKLRGRSVYFPTYWQRNIVQKWVSYKWDGGNAKELAKDLEVSVETIRQATAKKKVAGPWKPARPAATTQLNLLEE